MTDPAPTKSARPTPRRGNADAGLTTRARRAANNAGDRFADGVDASPLAVLAGGIAVGLAVGALLPKSGLEGQYLGPLGAKLNAGARTAANAAADAGRAELAAAGLSRGGANEQLAKLLGALVAALGSASSAARETRQRRPSANGAKG